MTYGVYHMISSKQNFANRCIYMDGAHHHTACTPCYPYAKVPSDELRSLPCYFLLNNPPIEDPAGTKSPFSLAEPYAPRPSPQLAYPFLFGGRGKLHDKHPTIELHVYSKVPQLLAGYPKEKGIFFLYLAFFQGYSRRLHYIL